MSQSVRGFYVAGLFLLFSAPSASGGEVLHLTAGKEEYSLTPYVEVLVDEGRLTINEVSSPESTERFVPAGPRTPSFGMTRSVIWVRFTVAAEGSGGGSLPTDWLLDVGWPYLSSVTLFAPASGTGKGNEPDWVEQHAGQTARTRTGPRNLYGRLCVFALPMDEDGPRTFYLRVESDAAIILPLKLYSEAAFTSAINRRMLWSGTLYGLLLAVILYNLLIYGTLRERIHIWFAASVIFVLLYLVECDALTPVFSEDPASAGTIRHVFLSGLMLCFGFFVREFSKGEKTASWADRLVLAFIFAVAVGVALTPLAPLQFLMKYDSIAGLAAPLAFVSPAISQWRRGFSPARFFLLGWVAIAVLGCVDALVILGVLPYTEWVLHALQVGTVLVALQFSHAVAYRIRLLRKQHEEALRKSEETFRALAENSIDIIARFDRDCRVLYVNSAVQQYLPAAPSAYVGKTVAEAGIPSEAAAWWEGAVREVFATRRPARLEMDFPENHWMDWRLVPEFDKSGEVGAVLASAREITERKVAEEQQRLLEAHLGQAQKIESVGRLAGGVAHDFNNLLMPILGYADLILTDAEKLDPEVREQVELIHKAGERARDLTRQLLAFGRKQTLQVQNLNMNELVAGFNEMLKRLIGEDIEIKTNLAPDIGMVKADRTQMEQVVLNLAVNSRDAMPSGGCITIETADAVLDDAYASLYPDVQPGKYVMLSVSDTGCGMNKEVQKMVFEPFYTTKGPGEGTGLGLATVYGVVKQHHGHISLYSEPGQGTTFRIYLPRVDEPVQETASDPHCVETVGGAETVLVVEDDDAVRKLTRNILCELGYNVLEAPGGSEALKLAKEMDSVDLLLTDVIMPEMSGRQVYERVSAIHHGIKALYMSGYPSDIIAHHGVLEEGINLLQKPFTRQSLAEKVREVLRRKTA